MISELYTSDITPRQLCDNISNLTQLQKFQFTKRPKYRFKPDDCGWWLVPGTDNPHYNLGKFIVDWKDKKSLLAYAGIHIEKGLSEELEPVFSSKKAKRFLMNDSWHWNKFLKDITKTNHFGDIGSKLSQKFGGLNIIIDGGYVNEPTKFDPYQDKNMGWDKYVFNWNLVDNSLSIESVKRTAYVLKLHEAKNIKSLIGVIDRESKNPWLWLNFYIAIPISLRASKEQENISNSELWDDLFSVIGKGFLTPAK